LRLDYVKIIPSVDGLAQDAYVRFVQQDSGADIENSFVLFTVKVLPNWTIISSAQAQLYPELKFKSVLPQAKALKSQSLEQNSLSSLGLEGTRVNKTEEQRKVRFIDGAWRRVREVKYKESEYKAIVDEDSQETWVEDTRYYGDIQGKVEGRGVEFDPVATGANLKVFKLKDLKLSVSSGAVAYSDALGNFNFPSENVQSTLNTGLTGRWAKVSSLQGVNLTFSATAVPGTPLSLVFNPTGATEFATAQVNGYYHTTFIHDWVQARLAPNTLPALDVSFPVNVNLPNSCNAYYNGGSINFYSAGGGCPNMAYDTVVYHEYGHFVDDRIGGITNGGLSEGWGDVFSAFATGQPKIGEGFFGPGTTLRRADNSYQYPPDGNAEVHALGQAWVGFAWHLRENLIASLGQDAGIKTAESLIIPTLYANSKDIATAVYDVLIRDDNDGNLGNLTPHYAEIADAANRHSIPIPDNDVTSPDPVTDLRVLSQNVASIVLGWTASGDDGKVGKASSYDIRYSFSPIKTADDFAAATPIFNTLFPLVSGQAESFSFAPPTLNTPLYLAIKVIDNMKNVSSLSNIVETTVKAKMLFSENFETGSSGWTSTGLWRLATNRSSSPLKSFAYNNGTNYDTGARNSGSLTTPAILIPDTAEGLVINFQQWINTENYSNYDVRSLEITKNNGVNWVSYPLNFNVEQQKWISDTLAIGGYAGQSVKLRFTFDTIDAVSNNYEGWYVDDVKVFISEPPVFIPIGDKTVMTGQLLEFTVSATDPNNSPLIYSVKSLPAGATFVNQKFRWIPGANQEGNYSVEFIVSNGSLSRSEIVNIGVAKDFSDLIVSGISSKWTNIAAGNSLNLSYSIKNIGYGSAGASGIVVHLSKDAIYGGPDDIYVMSGGVAPIGANQSQAMTDMAMQIPFNLQTGNYYLCARADDTNIVVESDETNNTACSLSTVLVAPADLTMTAISGPTTVTPGIPFPLSNTVKNLGLGTVTNLSVGFYASVDSVITTSDIFIGSRYINVLPDNASSTTVNNVATANNIPAGSYYLGAIADFSNNIKETDENNNAAVTLQPAVIGASKADFVMTALSGSVSVVNGDNVSLNYTIKNQGTGISNKTTVSFFLSADATITGSDSFVAAFNDVPALAAGQAYIGSITVTVPYFVTPGNYYWGAIVNPAGSTQSETDKTNNALAGNKVLISAISAPVLNSAIAGNAQVTLNWTSVPGAIGYTVKYGTAPGNYSVETAAGNSTSYTIINLKSNTEYYFVVVANNSVGSSVNSNEKSATPQDPVANAKIAIDNYFIQIAAGLDTTEAKIKLDMAIAAVTSPGDQTVVFEYYNSVAMATVKEAIDEYFAQISAAQNTDAAKFILGNAMSAVIKPADQTVAGEYYNSVALSTAKTAVDSYFKALAAAQNTDAVKFILGNAMSAVIKPADQTVSGEYYNSVALSTAKTAVDNYFKAIAAAQNTDAVKFILGNAMSAVVKPADQTVSGEYYNSVALATAKTAVDNFVTAILAGQNTDAVQFILNSAMSAIIKPADQTVAGEYYNSALLKTLKPVFNSATAGDAQVVLNWNSVPTATGYTVKYGTVQGNYSSTIEVGSATAYTVSGLTNGTTYYFVVVAKNALGSSRNSDELSATPKIPAPDLIISAVSGPANGKAGSPVVITDTVTNKGTKAATGFYVAYYLSSDPVITSTDTVVYYRYVPSLAVGASNTGSITYNIPNLSPGTYYLGAIADVFNFLVESDEKNNAKAGDAITIASSSTDLVISAMTVPSVGKVGSPVTMTDTVTNQGTGNANGFYVAYYLSKDPVITTADTRVFYRYVPSLAAGISNTGSVTYNIPNIAPGTYYWGAIADAFNYQSEVDESNNSKTANTITIAPTTTDLVMSKVSAPAGGKVGSLIAITDTVTNQGTGAAGGFYVAYYLSKDAVITTTDTVVYYRYVPSLAQGTSNTGSMTFKIPNLAPGTYYLGAIADPFNYQSEVNKTNNASVGKTFNISP
jgi:subtilase family serine protease/ribosomal protein S20